eukprot:GILI01002098.1.p1 GENE.GILI01002098.1~~GILI01002098.1.p1  ORF type:complete len:478 (-),score=189.36 GILI01002098.1:225-1658(-)
MNKAFVLASLVLLGVVSCASADIILPPVKEGAKEKVLVIVHGALVDHTKYQPVAAKIQQTSSLKLWVALPSFVFDVPNPLQVASSIRNLVDMIKSKGAQIEDSDVFIAGHSLGGVMSRQVAADNYGGLILLGSYLEPQGGKLSLLTYPKPVLTLGGELDGLTRPQRLALEYAEFMAVKDEKGAEFVSIAKPVVVLPSVTHSQFAADADVKTDLAREITDPEAHAMIAETVSAFLQVHANVDVSKSKAVLSKAVEQTHKFLAPFLALREMEATSWCQKAQVSLLANEGVEVQKLVAANGELYNNIASFAQSKPAAKLDGSSVATANPSYPGYVWNPADISSLSFAAVDIGCKMKSADAVLDLLDRKATGPAVTCRELNQASLEFALSLLPASSLERYQKRGKQIVLADDVEKGSGITWISSALNWNEKKGDDGKTFVEVASPVLKTSTTTPLVPGMHYCKLLSPARVFEWIQTDCLRQ